MQELALAGMDIARLNFSHGTFQQHQAYFSLVQEISEKIGRPIGILQDLEGYKIRTGPLKNKSLPLKEDDLLWLTSENRDEGGRSVSISYPELYRFVGPGDKVFVDDGKIELHIEKVLEGKIKTRVIIGGLLGERKGIHIPGLSPEFPSLTDRDKKDIYLGIQMGVDYIAQSFVREARGILAIKDILKERGGENIRVLAKIEDSRGVDNIDEIIRVSDGIMIARGDMGVCLPRARVPLIQKMIIKKCNQNGRPVITATQMLDSMMHNHHPTRAEVADVANAIIDGTDLVMLSGETATGSYPVEAVKEMYRIAVTTEACLSYHKLLEEREILPRETFADSIAFATRQLAELTRAQAIIAFTLSGNTAMTISKYRPESRIIAATPNYSVAKRLLLYWGVEVMMVDEVPDIESCFEQFLTEAIKKGLIDKGKPIVITSGISKESGKPAGTIRLFSLEGK